MNSNPSVGSFRALRLAQVISKTGMSKTHVYRLMNAGQFPKPKKLSMRVVAWDEAVLDAWLAQKFNGVQS
jgi:prophage regulatory protein